MAKTVVVDQPAEVRIGEYVVHPLRQFVPEMSAEDLETLTTQLRDSRVQPFPIRVDAEGRILDGRAQLRACLALGIDPRLETVESDPAWIVLTSMSRTEYTKPQYAFTAARLLPYLRPAARQNQRTAGKPLPENLGKGEVVEIAARAIGGTNAAYVRDAAAIIAAELNDVVRLVHTGRLRLFSQALTLAELPPDKYKVAVKDIDAGKEPARVLSPTKTDDVWQTPPYIVEAIRLAFGGEIACDPCAVDDREHSTVNATREIPKGENGLSDELRDWPDATFVNPPFSTPDEWVRNAIAVAKDIKRRIIMLLPVHTDTEYIADLFEVASNVLLVSGRVGFRKPGRRRSSKTGRNGTMLVGLNIPMELVQMFGVEGVIVNPSRRTPPDNLEAAREYYASLNATEAGSPSWPESEEEREAFQRFLDAQSEQDEIELFAGRRSVAEARES